MKPVVHDFVIDVLATAKAYKLDTLACRAEELLKQEFASQPEAPDPHTCDWFGRFTCRVCGKHRDQPEAPKGQDASPFKLEYENMDLAESVEHLERDLAAANARANAAERNWEQEERSHRDSLKRWGDTIAERNQLAARVTSMQAELDIAWADDDPCETCTPEERKVLDACRRWVDPNDETGTGVDEVFQACRGLV